MQQRQEERDAEADRQKLAHEHEMQALRAEMEAQHAVAEVNRKKLMDELKILSASAKGGAIGSVSVITTPKKKEEQAIIAGGGGEGLMTSVDGGSGRIRIHIHR